MRCATLEKMRVNLREREGVGSNDGEKAGERRDVVRISGCARIRRSPYLSAIERICKRDGSNITKSTLVYVVRDAQYIA